LFRDARAARRTGELESARALYSELQASFPESSEARVSRVSLGKLLLLEGDAAAAERQFRAYLASAGGDLVEEALVGRAEALARLGESGEERRVWQLLQARYPSSVYGERARKRLEEMARTRTSASESSAER
jgi:TolA-binding protein